MRGIVDSHNRLRNNTSNTSVIRVSNQNPKELRVAYLLWLPPLGWLGAHKFYLGQRGPAVRMGVILTISSLWVGLPWAVSPSSWILYVYPWAISLLGATVLWWIADGYLLRGRVMNYDGQRPDHRVKVKSMLVAYLLWLPPLGWLGAHRLYAKRWSGAVFLGLSVLWPFGLRIIYLATSPGDLVGPFEEWFTFSAIVLTPLAVWWVFDGIMTGDIIEKHDAESSASSGEGPPIS